MAVKAELNKSYRSFQTLPDDRQQNNELHPVRDSMRCCHC